MQIGSYASRADFAYSRDFAEAGDRLDRIEDDDLARYGLDASGIARLRERFAGWPRS